MVYGGGGETRGFWFCMLAVISPSLRYCWRKESDGGSIFKIEDYSKEAENEDEYSSIRCRYRVRK